jgi:hypothetical protein
MRLTEAIEQNDGFPGFAYANRHLLRAARFTPQIGEDVISRFGLFPASRCLIASAHGFLFFTHILTFLLSLITWCFVLLDLVRCEPVRS